MLIELLELDDELEEREGLASRVRPAEGRRDVRPPTFAGLTGFSESAVLLGPTVLDGPTALAGPVALFGPAVFASPPVEPGPAADVLEPEREPDPEPREARPPPPPERAAEREPPGVARAARAAENGAAAEREADPPEREMLEEVELRVDGVDKLRGAE